MENDCATLDNTPEDEYFFGDNDLKRDYLDKPARVSMTPKEAQALSNEEARLYDARQEANNAWTNRLDIDQCAQYVEADHAWRMSYQALHDAEKEFPHLFAPFSAKW